MDWSGKRGKVQDLLDHMGPRELPVSGPEASGEELIRTIARYPHSRVLYVVDPEGRLLGALSLGTLVRHVYATSHDAGLLARRTLHQITAENAADMMIVHPLSASLDEDLGQVIRKMVRHNVKEVPVLDAAGLLVGDVTILDLLQFSLS